MSFPAAVLGQDRPESIRPVPLPRRQRYYPSSADWRHEVLYFLLPDRFSDGGEANRPLLQRANRAAARPDGFRFDRWAESGGSRYQGGNLAGIRSKLDYLQNLGVTALWIGPVFKQRVHWDSYHGYAIQDFLEVDPRFGTRQDLADLIDAAHARQLRVILDVVFNHTGDNWVYADTPHGDPGYLPWPQHYRRGPWRDGHGGLTPQPQGADDGVWPRELQPEEYYTRAGRGDLGRGDIDDPHAEMRRTDFISNRDVNFDGTQALDDLARCYKYWIALTDCDGFRIDTLKHMDQETGRNFCGAIKEYAANLGKADFFLVGEVAGADSDARRYLQVLGSNLTATLDIGESRRALQGVAKGLRPPQDYFAPLSHWEDELGSHRNAGRRHVSILDDHDHVSGDKVRFSADAAPEERQVVAGVAIQLFSLGIPCLYYGTEQALAGPEKALRDQFLPDWNVGDPPPDKYLREAMFGPEHPRRPGRDGLPANGLGQDPGLPGFGPFGTCGAHCFDPNSPAYVRIAALTALRSQYPVLRVGRQYERPLAAPGGSFAPAGAGQLITWSRILDDEEALCVVNGNGATDQSADVLVDAALNSPTAPGDPWGAGGTPVLEVLVNSAQAAASAAGLSYTGPHPVGQRLPVHTRDGNAFVEIRNLPPAEVLVLINRP